MKPRVDLRQILPHDERALQAGINARELFDHPTAKGDLGEGAWCRLLRGFLPERYQVSKAFVLDARGECSDQIDLVIHDRHLCPLLFEENDQRYIPAESVFAVFEAKPALNKSVIEYAQAKAQSVRRLHRTSVSLVRRGVGRAPREPFLIVPGVLAVESDWFPPFGEALRRVLTDDDPERESFSSAAWRSTVRSMCSTRPTSSSRSATGRRFDVLSAAPVPPPAADRQPDGD
ncbi:MAG: hypothetical protein OXG37_13715 [Actinomycetia bacterium]|nr:hypothetical protein [Actinomycetes bacterium]